MKQVVVRYLVKWRGFGEEEATWEDAESLRLHAQDAIDEYEYRQANERGEEVVGLHCVHQLVSEGGGTLTLQSIIVGGTEGKQSSTQPRQGSQGRVHHLRQGGQRGVRSG